MRNLIKKINSINTPWINDINLIIIDNEQLNELFVNSVNYKNQNDIQIIDIKEFNNKQKIILSIFINNYIGTNPVISKYNIYDELIPKKINILDFQPIFRGFYVGLELLKSNLNKFDYQNILNIGVLPTLLESYLNISTINFSNIDFLKILSSKEDNYKLYQNMIDKLLKQYNIRLIDVKKFYNNLDDLFKLKTLQNKYDLIIFDIYKNFDDNISEDFLNTINIRYLSAILNAKYIIFQFVFAINKLNKDGDLIMFLPGSNHVIYQQLISIMGHLFEKIELCNIEIDYSYRYFVICKKFNQNNLLIDQLTKKFNIIPDNILISIYDDKFKILDINFETLLIEKFNYINNKINFINKYFHNQQFIKKLNYDIHYQQLTNTIKWLEHTIDPIKINYEIQSELFDYKTNLIDKLLIIKKTEFTLKKNNYKLNIFNKKISKEEFINLLPIMTYLDFENMIIYDNIYTKTNYISVINHKKIYDKMPDINFKNINLSIIEILSNVEKSNLENSILLYCKDELNFMKLLKYFNINELTYIEWESYLNNKTNIFKNYPKNLIIQFNINLLSPLLLSLIYSYSIIYENGKIIKSRFDNYIYIYFNNPKSEDKISHFNLLEKISINDENILLSTINENFLYEFNSILNIIYVKHLVNILRYKYFIIDENYINLFKLKMRKDRIIHKYTKQIIELIYL